MAAAPVIQQSRRRGGVGVVAEGRIAVGGEFDFGRAAAEVFDGGIDEPETDLSRGARPTPGARLELIGRVIVFVLDLPLVKATVHAAGFLQIHHRAVIPIVGGKHFHVPVGVHGHPVEYLVVKFGAKAGFADRGGGIIGFVRENRVGVKAGIAAPEGVADFDVGRHAAAGAAAQRCALVKALDGNLAALTAVRLWINRDPRKVLAPRRVVRPITGLVPGGRIEHFQTAVFEQGQVAGTLRGLCGHDAVGERESRVIL